MPKHTKRKIHASKVREQNKTTKQWGGVIPDITFTGSTGKDAELFVAFQQGIKNFGFTGKYVIGKNKKKKLEYTKTQEVADLKKLKDIYATAYQHQQPRLKKILAESIYETGKQGDFIYSEIDEEQWPFYAKSLEYKQFVDDLCFPKTSRHQSVGASATPQGATSQRASFSISKQKTSSEEAINLAEKNTQAAKGNYTPNQRKKRLEELNKQFANAATNRENNSISKHEEKLRQMYGENWKEIIKLSPSKRPKPFSHMQAANNWEMVNSDSN